jgi:hypothetical protein
MDQQNKNTEGVSAFTKRVDSLPLVSTAPIGVSTNVATTKPYQEYYQKFMVLDPSARTLPNGDGVIRISPFDDYVIFTLYDDTIGSVPIDPANQKTANPNQAAAATNTAEKPIDLSNVGTLTLVFVGENDEIRIPNWTQVETVDLSQGQVLFRIDKESSKKILSLDNNNFYISTRMEDPNGISDESVLYTGTFLGLTDAAKATMTEKMEAQAALYSDELARLQLQISNYEANQNEYISTIEELNSTIIALENSNTTLVDQVDQLSKALGSTESELAMEEARNVQLRADLARKKQLQVMSLKVAANQSKSKAKKGRFFRQSAKANQSFSTTNDKITTIKEINQRSNNRSNNRKEIPRSFREVS